MNHIEVAAKHSGCGILPDEQALQNSNVVEVDKKVNILLITIFRHSNWSI